MMTSVSRGHLVVSRGQCLLLRQQEVQQLISDYNNVRMEVEYHADMRVTGVSLEQ